MRYALTGILGGDLPNLVQMDVSPLAGILAEGLLHYLLFFDRVCFANSGAEAVEASIKFARKATGRMEPDMVLISKTLSGGHIPVGAVLARRGIFERVFDSMDRSVVHNLTFAANDLAMAAGIVTLEILESEGLIENAHRMGARLLATFEAMAARFEMVKAVRGKGLLIGIEFGQPHSLNSKGHGD